MSWWRVRAQRTVSEQIPAPPAAVRAFYVDLDNIVKLHPLVTSVRTVARTDTADGYRQAYRVQDRIPLGPISFRISYQATLEVPSDPTGAADVITEARQFPRVRLHGVVSFEGSGDGTLLTERILIEAPRPLAGFTTREALKAHAAMLAGIRRQFTH